MHEPITVGGVTFEGKDADTYVTTLRRIRRNAQRVRGANALCNYLYELATLRLLEVDGLRSDELQALEAEMRQA